MQRRLPLTASMAAVGRAPREAADGQPRALATTVLAALAAAGALVLFAPIDARSFERWQLPKELCVEACALALLFVAPRRARLDGLDLALLASAAIGVLSAVLAVEPWIGMRHAGLTLAAVALALAVRGLGPDARDTAREGVLAALVLVALLALAETFGLVVGLSGHGRAPGATLGQRNVVAHVLALGVPCAWRAGTRELASRRERVLGAMVLLVSVAAILATRSRAGWIALAAGVITMGALEVRRSPNRTVATVMTVISAGALTVLARPALPWSRPHPYRETLAHLLDARSGSGHGRLVQIAASLDWLRVDPWLGAGPGNWRVVYPALSPAGDPTVMPDAIDPVGRLLTCDVVAALVERGVLGAIAGIAVLVAALHAMTRDAPGEAQSADRATASAPFAERPGADPSLRSASLGCVAAALPLVLLDTVLEVAAPLAVMVVLATPAAREGEGWAAPRATRGAVTGVFAVLLAGAVGHRSVELTAAWIADDRASVEALERAVALDPGGYEARMRLAIALRSRGCDAARPVLQDARVLRPYDPMPGALLARCAARE